jgi:hypothetical protein
MMMRNLTSISFVVLILFTSCSTTVRQERNKAIPLVIDTVGGVQLFDLNLCYKDVDFSGILLLDGGNEDGNRFVLTSHFGMTVFDIETEGNGYRVHYAIPAINHRKVLYLLWSDFSILMKPDYFKNIKYSFDEEGKLVSLTRSGSITKTEIYFKDFLDGYPQDIEINHPYLHLNITLNKIKNGNTESL